MKKHMIRKRKLEGNINNNSQTASSSKISKFSSSSLIDACVELVTKNGRPLSIIQDSGFRKIIDYITEILHISIAINTNNIRDAVIKKATEIRNLIKLEIKDTLISLKIDSATRHLRSFLGINLQYIKNGKIIIRTLGVKEIFNRSTGNNLKNLIIETLARYELDVNNIYTITTDNGANMLKMIRLLEKEQTNNDDDINDDNDDDNNSINSRNEEELFQNYTEKFYLEGEQLFTTEKTNFKVIGVRCVAHTLQLAIHDVIKENNVNHVLQKARYLVKKLRSSSMLLALKTMKLKMPILDCITRWCSTFNMLERLLQLKDFCNEVNEVNLTDDEWASVQELVHILKPATIATKRLQYEQLAMADFYALWIELKLNIIKIQNNYASMLTNAINSREKLLLENDALLASVFLDLRYKNLLSQAQKEKAIIHLINIWEHYQKTYQSQKVLIPEGAISSNNASSETIDDMEKFLLQKDEEAKHSAVHNAAFNITQSLNAFSQMPRIDRGNNLLEYWEHEKHAYPELYTLSKIVHAVPATQVSVERLFSGLRFILNDQRSRLNCDIVDDIMIIRTNDSSV